MRKLKTTPIIAPTYYIVAGTEGNEGINIARDPDGVANIEELSDDKWFLLQANEDKWTGACSPRCLVGIQRLKNMG